MDNQVWVIDLKNPGPEMYWATSLPNRIREKYLNEANSDKFILYYDKGEIKKIIFLDFTEYKLFKQKLELELELIVNWLKDC